MEEPSVAYYYGGWNGRDIYCGRVCYGEGKGFLVTNDSTPEGLAKRMIGKVEGIPLFKNGVSEQHEKFCADIKMPVRKLTPDEENRFFKALGIEKK